MRSLLIGVLIFGSAIVYWDYRLNVKKQYLLSYAAPFENQCQTQTGCTIRPAGWKVFTENCYYDPSAKHPIGYCATNNSFKLSWRIATGVTLIATGGKDKPVSIEKEID